LLDGNNMKQMTKIEALTKLASLIGNSSTDFNWKEFETCNVGLLIRVVTGMTYAEMKKEREMFFRIYEMRGEKSVKEVDYGDWHQFKQDFPAHKMFVALNDAGFNDNELHYFEYLFDYRVHNRAEQNGKKLLRDRRFPNYWSTTRKNVLLYTRTWLEMEKIAASETVEGALAQR
jgi:hypothetical protein